VGSGENYLVVRPERRVEGTVTGKPGTAGGFFGRSIQKNTLIVSATKKIPTGFPKKI
jgi:hypothetical protein